MKRCEHCGSVLEPGRPTRAQLAVLCAIDRLTRDCGFAPTFNEVSRWNGRAMSTVAEHVKHLRAKGLLIHAEYNANFALVLTEAGRAAVGAK